MRIFALTCKKQTALNAKYQSTLCLSRKVCNFFVKDKRILHILLVCRNFNFIVLVRLAQKNRI